MSEIFCQHFYDPNNKGDEHYDCGISFGSVWKCMRDTSTVKTADEAKVELQKLVASNPEARPFGLAASLLAA